jgi:osmoprotectant transport system substrate-binding protein
MSPFVTAPHRSRRRLLAATATAVGLASLLAACGSAGSSGSHPSAATPSGSAAAVATCAPVSGSQLVVLTDDKKLQNADNIIPAVNAKAASADPGLIPVLDTVSAALDTDKLIALNKAVDVDRKTSANVAKQFVSDNNLASTSTSGKGKSVTVGAANFSENATLANIYADVLKSAGYSTKVQDAGARETYLTALEKGQLTVMPEYTSTLTEFINQKLNGAGATPLASGDLDKTVTALTGLGQKVGLVFGKPSAAQDQNAFAVTQAFADQHGVKTLSELAAKCGGLVLGGPPECATRPYCQPGLAKTYGLQFASFKALDSGGPLTKAALQKGQISIGLVFSSDGQLAATS